MSTRSLIAIKEIGKESEVFVLDEDEEVRKNALKNGEIVIFPKEYFYPYGFKEVYSDECIKENTYGIHWWNDSWSSLKARLFLETKHLSGIKKLVKKARIIARYYLKEKKK